MGMFGGMGSGTQYTGGGGQYPMYRRAQQIAPTPKAQAPAPALQPEQPHQVSTMPSPMPVGQVGGESTGLNTGGMSAGT